MLQHDGAHLISSHSASSHAMTQSDHLTGLAIGQAYVIGVHPVSSGAVTSSEQLGSHVGRQIKPGIDASGVVVGDGVAVTRGIDCEASETFHYLLSRFLYC